MSAVGRALVAVVATLNHTTQDHNQITKKRDDKLNHTIPHHYEFPPSLSLQVFFGATIPEDTPPEALLHFGTGRAAD
jgi:hypothetical protein